MRSNAAAACAARARQTQRMGAAAIESAPFRIYARPQAPKGKLEPVAANASVLLPLDGCSATRDV